MVGKTKAGKKIAQVQQGAETRMLPAVPAEQHGNDTDMNRKNAYSFEQRQDEII